MLLFEASRSKRTPRSFNCKTPFLLSLLIGLSRLATQKTVEGDFLYHAPKYRAFEEPGLKNPSSKNPIDETKVSPSLSKFPGVMMSCEVRGFMKQNNKK